MGALCASSSFALSLVALLRPKFVQRQVAAHAASSCGGLMVTLPAAQVASGDNAADRPHRETGVLAQNRSAIECNRVLPSARAVLPQEIRADVHAILNLLAVRALDFRSVLIFSASV